MARKIWLAKVVLSRAGVAWDATEELDQRGTFPLLKCLSFLS